MNVNGVAFQARSALMATAVGEGTWRDWLSNFAQSQPTFRNVIHPSTKIPAEEFLALNDAIVDRFYAGDEHAYWQLGERSAVYALSQGHLKGQFGPHDVRKFLQYTTEIWRGYFDEGEVVVTPAAENTIEVQLVGVPLHHVYFEFTVMGFGTGGLRFVGAKNPAPNRVRGFSKGDEDVLYQFHVA